LACQAFAAPDFCSHSWQYQLLNKKQLSKILGSKIKHKALAGNKLKISAPMRLEKSIN
jgi:hypothetical protein